jgi:5-methylcytosine-specific restriction endonuclease McrA
VSSITLLAEKTCRSCLEVKERHLFYADKTNKDRLSSFCCECVKARARANRLADPDAYRAKQKVRYRTPKRQAWYAAYHKKVAAHRREYMAAYYAARRTEWRAKYRTPEKDAEYQAQRRSFVLAGGTYMVTERDWRRLVARHGGLCAYCKERPWEHRDHVVPLSRGGRHTIGNLLPACAPCNQSKSARLLMEWPH